MNKLLYLDYKHVYFPLSIDIPFPKLSPGPTS